MAEQVYSHRDRLCSSCRELKTHNEHNFRLVREVRSGRDYTYIKRLCLKCEHLKRVEWGRVHQERQNAQRKVKASPQKYRNDNLKSKYGIDQEEYSRLLALQGGVCAICMAQKNESHKSGREIPLSVDHDHETGRIRGLLCGSCNRGLGDFRDSVGSLERAIKYLRSQHG